MIIIKTMIDLPEHCYDCPCHDGESGYCQADKEHRYSDYRPFWCPLAEVNDQNIERLGMEAIMSELSRVLTKLAEPQEEKNCSNCKFWCLDADDKDKRCKYCFNQDEWQAESEGENDN